MCIYEKEVSADSSQENPLLRTRPLPQRLLSPVTCQMRTETNFDPGPASVCPTFLEINKQRISLAVCKNTSNTAELTIHASFE